MAEQTFKVGDKVRVAPWATVAPDFPPEMTVTSVGEANAMCRWDIGGAYDYCLFPLEVIELVLR